MVREGLDIGKSDEDLVTETKKRRLRFWLIGLAAGVVILAGVIILIVLLANRDKDDNPDQGEQNGSSEETDDPDITLPPTTTTTTTTTDPEQIADPEPISLDDIIQGKLTPLRFPGVWISDDEYIYKDEEDSLISYIPINDTKKELLNSTAVPLLAQMFDFELSPDGNELMIAWGYRKLYRHSYTALYSCVNLMTSVVTPISPPDPSPPTTRVTRSDNLVEDPHLDLFVWGPNNSLAFVYQNNIYYKSSVDSADIIVLTTDGIPGTIYNGVPDWVYEEEVFGSHKAIWFSPDGNFLAYGRFDDTNTRIMTIPFYGQPGEVEYQYTRQLQVRYPKAGTTNPSVQVVLVDLQGNPPIQRPINSPSDLSEPILAAVSFANNLNVAVTWMNRIQNRSIVLMCREDVPQPNFCQQVFEYEEANGWVDMMRSLVFNEAGTSFVTILPQVIGDDSWRQVVQVTESENGLWTLQARTNVANTVLEIIRWDEEDEHVWYLATSAQDSANQHLYRVNSAGEIHCFTCSIRHSLDTACNYNEVSFSKQGEFVTVTCAGPEIPEVYIYNKLGGRVSVVENNTALSQLLNDKTKLGSQRFSVPLAEGSAQVSLLTPHNFDSSGHTKYPLLINVYGGPDSAQVTERWALDWGSSLVSRFNIIVAIIDGRGSGLSGNNNLFSLYRNLGTVEVEDQINVTRHLQETLAFVDANRTCIWGWSYGGYVAALALARGGDVFRCAMSVAPVTDWIYYDSIYTERYMGLPTEEDNLQGYVAAEVNTEKVAQALATKSFMLVHGTLDDNVHYQQAMMLARVLQQYDVYFTQMSYADEDHSLNGVKPHFYHGLERFLRNNHMLRIK